MSRFDYILQGPGDGTWFDAFPIIRRLLRRHRRIAIVWAVEDVQWVRPDLDKRQAWEVLQSVQNHHDAAVGVCWEVLSATAEVLYPELEETL